MLPITLFLALVASVSAASIPSSDSTNPFLDANGPPSSSDLGFDFIPPNDDISSPLWGILPDAVETREAFENDGEEMLDNESEHAGEISGVDSNDGNEIQSRATILGVDFGFNREFTDKVNSERRRRGLKTLQSSFTLARLSDIFLRQIVAKRECKMMAWDKLKEYKMSQNYYMEDRPRSTDFMVNAWKKQNLKAVADSKQTMIGCKRTSWLVRGVRTCHVVICTMADNSSKIPKLPIPGRIAAIQKQ
ncbi:hypothetical protein HDU67_004937 [Dinochytrium kinnereticum]|nr:hypothetical protein HDU67_004937 [Dinochytrium kinnereticum]